MGYRDVLTIEGGTVRSLVRRDFIQIWRYCIRGWPFRVLVFLCFPAFLRSPRACQSARTVARSRRTFRPPLEFGSRGDYGGVCFKIAELRFRQAVYNSSRHSGSSLHKKIHIQHIRVQVTLLFFPYLRLLGSHDLGRDPWWTAAHWCSGNVRRNSGKGSNTTLA